MSGGPKSTSAAANLRNQLLSTDIGNIDVRDEVPVMQQQQQQQQHYQQHYPHQFPPHQQQQQQIQQNQFMNNGYPQPQAPMSHPKKHSMTSTGSSNGKGFFHLKSSKKSKSFSGGDDEDDDDKDVVLDNTQANGMTFAEISTIKDRGRYGGGSSFDTTPIIPTLQTGFVGSGANVSGNQYRKQMNNMKKMSYANAGKAMSLQVVPGVNPYQRQQQQRMFQQQQPPQGFMGGNPRANSLMTPPPTAFQQQQQQQYHPMMRPNPRANSLMSGPPPPQLQHQQQQQFQQGRPPFNPQQQQPQLMQRYGPPPVSNGNPGRIPPPRAMSLQTGTNMYQQQQQQQPFRANGLGSIPDETTQGPIRPQQQQPPSQRPIQQFPLAHQQQQQPINQRTSQPERQLASDDLPIAESSHHNIKASSSSSDNNHVTGEFEDSFESIAEGEDDDDDSHNTVLVHEESPSKMKRSNGLPHLSLLNLRDDDEEEEEQDEEHESTDEDIAPSEHVDPASQLTAPSQHAEDQTKRTVTPPPPIEKNFISPQQQQQTLAVDRSPFKQQQTTTTTTTSKSVASDQKAHRAAKSASSMSGYSSFSAISETSTQNQHLQNQRALYGTIKNDTNASTLNTEMFVTASQFSLMGGIGGSGEGQDDTEDLSYFKNKKQDATPEDEESASNTNAATELGEDYGDDDTATIPGSFNVSSNHSMATPVIANPNVRQFEDSVTPTAVSRDSPRNKKRLSVSDQASLDSSSTKRSSFKLLKSPKFLSNWKIRRASKKENTPVFPSSPDLPRNSQASDSTTSTVPPSKVPVPARKQHYGANISNDADESASDVEPIPRTLDPSRQSSANHLPIGTSAGLQSSFELEPSTAPLVQASTVASAKMGPEPAVLDKERKLEFTVDQLGIMQGKLDIMNELELVSAELIQSVKREIKLEESLQIGATQPSPYFNERTHAQLIADLTKRLNEERHKRYIAEEHVLMYQTGTKPSSLSLNYELSQLKTSNLLKDDQIAKLQTELQQLNNQHKLQTDQLKSENYTLAHEIIPNLKNQIQFLTKDENNLNIMQQRLKIAINDNETLQRLIDDLQQTAGMMDIPKYGNHSNGSTSSFTFVDKEADKKVNEFKLNSGNSNNSSPAKSIGKTYNKTGTGSGSNNGMRVGSNFSLINVTTTGEK
ncbi:hypothetical protein WICPIJ_000466 [Wickerhamomyces pijperi]|uniref:Uncharacterized protein n=1 Tax=Wickerhamomyces pijperi TaxID=599730 RepID=A0A9P8QG80_WICPI|nr:hypothetical protein WICPIJ_000466 [Wickerhamomyces pijperi]